MNPTVAFMLANYAARPLNYFRESWEQAERATSAYFKPVKSFGARFESYLADVRALGFDAVELWQPMLDARWMKDDQLEIAVDLLDEYEMQVVSYAGWLGRTDDEFEAACEIAAELGAPLLVGGTRADRAMMADTLQKYGLGWAYENEAEKTAREILGKIRRDNTLGICADVGAFAVHDMDAADALRELAPRLLHVHLKEIRADGATCRFGEGIVPLERCVRVLAEVGYGGALSIEHETAQYDPSEDVRASLEMLKNWLA